MAYDQEQLLEKELSTIDESIEYADRAQVMWVNIDGLHNSDILEKLGRYFNIHSLTLEDIMNTGHRPKTEDFESYLYLVFKMLVFDQDKMHIVTEQVSLILGPHFLLSFQEKEGDLFNSVRERIRKAKGRIRKLDSDYLAYALVDAVVDHYYLVLEEVGTIIESLEEKILADPDPETLHSIHHLKREMIFFRKQVWPLRETLNALSKDQSNLIHETTHIFLRDVYDHTIQAVETIDSFRDILSGLQDLYLSTISNKMNEVMKVLTIIATIFIPLTFIAGIYGMNFKFMPELELKWAYPALWAVLIVIFCLMLVWFKRKRWL
jgi:magnesium transporter